MTDTDANTHAMNEYLNKQQEREEAFDNLLSETLSDRIQLEGIIEEIKLTAKDYSGYDFTEDIEEMIKDML
jgi:hypothetical protein